MWYLTVYTLELFIFLFFWSFSLVKSLFLNLLFTVGGSYVYYESYSKSYIHLFKK